MFHVGQKVVCVRAAKTNTLNVPELVEGTKYRIRWVGEDKGKVKVKLEGVVRRVFDIVDPNDSPFIASRFRPVVERGTESGMAVLHEILDRETNPVKAPTRKVKA